MMMSVAKKAKESRSEKLPAQRGERWAKKARVIVCCRDLVADRRKMMMFTPFLVVTFWETNDNFIPLGRGTKNFKKFSLFRTFHISCLSRQPD